MYKLVILIFLSVIQSAIAGGSMGYVQYDEKHVEIVNAGIDPITSYYENSSVAEKRSLLFYLDKYLDPYYKYELPYADQIFTWLGNELEKATVVEVKEDILQLLSDYSDLDYQDCEIAEDGKVICFSGGNKT